MKANIGRISHGGNKQSAIRYLMAKVQNGNDGFADAATKLGCEPELEALATAIANVLSNPNDIERMVKKLKKNEERRANAMAKRRTMKRQQGVVETVDPRTALEREIQSVTQKISVEQLGIEECQKKLKELENDSADKVQAAEQLREQLKKLMSECVQLERHAKETAEEQKLHEDALLQLDATLLKLKAELRSLNTLHVSIGMELEGTMTLESYELDKTSLKSKMAEFITMPENYPEEFIELAELAELHVVRTVAKAMLVAEKLTAESGNAVVFHMKECDAATLLEYAGLKVAIEKKEG